MVKSVSVPLSVLLLSFLLSAFSLSQPLDPQEANLSLDLVNRPELGEEFMDWGLGLFLHWSLVEYVHQLQPECLVTRGEMSTPEQEIPDAPIPGPWEACFTLGTQWQFKPTTNIINRAGN